MNYLFAIEVNGMRIGLSKGFVGLSRLQEEIVVGFDAQRRKGVW